MKPSLCFLHQWTGAVWSSGYRGHQSDHEHGHEQSYQQQQQSHYGYPQQDNAEKLDEPKGGFMGMLRGFLDKMRGKTKGGSDAMVLDDKLITL